MRDMIVVHLSMPGEFQLAVAAPAKSALPLTFGMFADGRCTRSAACHVCERFAAPRWSPPRLAPRVYPAVSGSSTAPPGPAGQHNNLSETIV
ncbi:hypothetical protein [Frankia sp. AgPm24]|uniref:hypothetical protein n=1 Tax=Frankia sp. AgPm24 TaxID=631128 RepID=UPI0020100BAB|nr:hypothetical protein [Frankia sp. AgPm24]